MPIDLRRRRAARLSEGRFLTTHSSILPVHAESSPGSDIWNTAIDLRPTRITTGGRDLWAISDNQFTFALGERSVSSGDGWIGFGGRRGQNAFWSRLQSVGYLHWPTRTWRDLGGAPTYNRANLTAERVTSHTLGGETFSRKARATWADLWPALPQGQIDLDLSISGRGIKEFIRVDAAARNWIRVNRPPLTPANQTWFGFQWEIDWTDIPRLFRGGVLVGSGEDFDDSLPLEMRDALDRLLGIFPNGDCWVEGIPLRDILNGTFTRAQVQRPVQRRFWTEGGTARFAVGIRCDILANMAPGDLIIDPPQVTDTATVGDCGEGSGRPGNWLANGQAGAECYISNQTGTVNDEASGAQFEMGTLTGDAATSAQVTWDWGDDQGNAANTLEYRISAHDAADPPDFSNTFTPIDSWTSTTAVSDISQVNNPTAGAQGIDNSANFLAMINELLTSYGDTIVDIALGWDGINTDTAYLSIADDSDAGKDDPAISVTQAAAGTSILRQVTQQWYG